MFQKDVQCYNGCLEQVESPLGMGEKVHAATWWIYTLCGGLSVSRNQYSLKKMGR